MFDCNETEYEAISICRHPDSALTVCSPTCALRSRLCLLSYVCPRFDLFALRSRLCLLSYDDEDVYYPKGRRPREDEEGEESYEKQRQRPTCAFGLICLPSDLACVCSRCLLSYDCQQMLTVYHQ
jgi:hypothetical protein